MYTDLDGNAHKDKQQVCSGQAEQEGVRYGHHLFEAADREDDQDVANETQQQGGAVEERVRDELL